MIDDFYGGERKSKALDELNIVPVLDMFISIIFFLLLSTSMIGLTKQVLPPSATKAVTSEVTTVPVNPKIFVIGTPQSMSAILKWEGASPGTQKLEISNQALISPKKFVEDLKKMVTDFKKKFPQEKTIQISLKSYVPYQVLISVMDGVREGLPDIILTSYTSAESLQE